MVKKQNYGRSDSTADEEASLCILKILFKEKWLNCQLPWSRRRIQERAVIVLWSHGWQEGRASPEWGAQPSVQNVQDRTGQKWLTFPPNCHIGNLWICVWQSIVIQEVPADTSWRVRGIAENDLLIKCHEFERVASWESLELFFSATTISDLGNNGLLCNYDWQLRKSIALWVCSRYTDAQTARTFCGSLRSKTYRSSQQNSSKRQICISYLWLVPCMKAVFYVVTHKTHCFHIKEVILMTFTIILNIVTKCDKIIVVLKFIIVHPYHRLNEYGL